MKNYIVWDKNAPEWSYRVKASSKRIAKLSGANLINTRCACSIDPKNIIVVKEREEQ